MGTPKKSLRGRLLLDGGQLGGSWFHRAVVLVCQHDEEGAFGLVLNRPTGTRMGDAVVASLPDCLRNLPLYAGGPVQPGALSYLHADALLPEASVMAGLTLGHSLDELVALAESPSSSSGLRVFSGYSGWSAGQLDDEIARKAWLVEPADLAWVMGPEAPTLWRRILKRKGGVYRLLADSPEDFSAN